MCILFFVLNPDPSEGQYRLILANNRDEFYDRPTQPADFWKDHPDCIGGVDMMSTREGGTWLGASTRGRVGVLTNILQDRDPTSLPGRPRGHLVTNYVTSDTPARDYLQPISDAGDQYKKFNLLLLEMNEPQEKIHYYSNEEGEGKPRTLQPGVTYGLSNSVLGKPFQKTNHGRSRFSTVVGQYGRTHQREALVQGLWDLMADQTRCFPDEQMLHQGGEFLLQGDLYPQRTAVYVNSPKARYGTRTTTLILVDRDGRCEYLEKSMREPVDVQNVIWDVKQYQFNMQCK